MPTRLESLASFGINVTSVAINTLLTNSHAAVLVDASGGARVITLPPAAGVVQRRIYAIKKDDASANTVTIDADGAETIDGALTKVLTAQNDVLMIQSDGVGWKILNGIGSVVVAGSAFGANFQEASVTPRTTTTGAGFSVKTTLTTPATFPAGTYLIWWFALGDTPLPTNGDFRLMSSAIGLIGMVQTLQCASAAERRVVGGFGTYALPAGVQTLEIQWRDAAPAGDTVGISEAHVALWRVG